ncbi:MAG: 2C-methyl-D-erythritol 2,4-cyclodiphosphate synthase [Flavobacteriales bacterium]|jgi:2C-methyl-D-erythritol 2,4-cyclodiphosphate synthase
MQAAIAEVAEVDLNQISVKATAPDRLGFTSAQKKV